MKVHYRNQKTPGFRAKRAQAIVEFALVLPILMMMLVGIFEAGRMIYTYAAVNNASREAARFGSALGLDDAGYHKYKHCDGIREMATRSAYFTPLTITIDYDRGPGYSPFASCDLTGVGEDGDFTVTTNDRIQVTVSASYSPLIRLIPFPSRTFTSISARSILGFVEVGESPASGSGSGSGSNTATATSPGTAVPSNTPTATVPSNTPTKTATSGPVATFTPLPSSTPTLVPTSTNTATPTFTATMTATATGTSTPVSSCNTITAGAISVINNTKVISMTITNPYIDVTVSTISLQWNNLGAQSGSPKTLTLDNTSLVSAYGTTIWSSLNDSSGTATLTPSSTLTLPGNNRQSTITFTFLQTYKDSSMSGKTTITVNLSTPGCSALTKTY